MIIPNLEMTGKKTFRKNIEIRTRDLRDTLIRNSQGDTIILIWQLLNLTKSRSKSFEIIY